MDKGKPLLLSNPFPVSFAEFGDRICQSRNIGSVEIFFQSFKNIIVSLRIFKGLLFVLAFHFRKGLQYLNMSQLLWTVVFILTKVECFSETKVLFVCFYNA